MATLTVEMIAGCGASEEAHAADEEDIHERGSTNCLRSLCSCLFPGLKFATGR